MTVRAPELVRPLGDSCGTKARRRIFAATHWLNLRRSTKKLFRRFLHVQEVEIPAYGHIRSVNEATFDSVAVNTYATKKFERVLYGRDGANRLIFPHRPPCPARADFVHKPTAELESVASHLAKDRLLSIANSIHDSLTHDSQGISERAYGEVTLRVSPMTSLLNSKRKTPVRGALAARGGPSWKATLSLLKEFPLVGKVRFKSKSMTGRFDCSVLRRVNVPPSLSRSPIDQFETSVFYDYKRSRDVRTQLAVVNLMANSDRPPSPALVSPRGAIKSSTAVIGNSYNRSASVLSRPCQPPGLIPRTAESDVSNLDSFHPTPEFGVQGVLQHSPGCISKLSKGFLIKPYSPVIVLVPRNRPDPYPLSDAIYNIRPSNLSTSVRGAIFLFEGVASRFPFNFLAWTFNGPAPPASSHCLKPAIDQHLVEYLNDDEREPGKRDVCELQRRSCRLLAPPPSPNVSRGGNREDALTRPRETSVKLAFSTHDLLVRKHRKKKSERSSGNCCSVFTLASFQVGSNIDRDTAHNEIASHWYFSPANRLVRQRDAITTYIRRVLRTPMGDQHGWSEVFQRRRCVRGVPATVDFH